MRTSLKSKEGERRKFRAVFSRTGKKVNYLGYSEDTILLTRVIDAATDELLTDHAWFTYSKAFEKAGLKEGDLLEFEARIKSYSKGYVNKKLGVNKRTNDFKLSNPTRITRIAS